MHTCMWHRCVASAGAVSDPRINLYWSMCTCIHTCVIHKCVASAGAVSDLRISLYWAMCTCIHMCVIHRCVASARAVQDPRITYIDLWHAYIRAWYTDVWPAQEQSKKKLMPGAAKAANHEKYMKLQHAWLCLQLPAPKNNAFDTIFTVVIESHKQHEKPSNETTQNTVLFWHSFYF